MHPLLPIVTVGIFTSHFSFCGIRFYDLTHVRTTFAHVQVKTESLSYDNVVKEIWIIFQWGLWTRHI